MAGVLVFEGSSSSHLGLVHLKKDRMADWSAAVVSACSDMILVSQFISGGPAGGREKPTRPLILSNQRFSLRSGV